MEQLLNFMQDYWLIALVVLIAIALFQVFVRSVFRLVSLFTVIGVIMVLILQYTPEQVIELGRSLVKQTGDVYEQTVAPVIEAELQDATYEFHEDGTYEIKTASIRIIGKKGDPKATVYYKEHQFEVDVSSFGGFIQEQIKRSGVTNTTL